MFRTLGTLDDQVWDGVTDLPMYQPTFPKWPKQQLSNIVKKLPEEGIKLLEAMLVYEPGERISALVAMNDPYFSNVKLPD
ncbi:Cyclin-dependent kinase 2-like [Oopsacas minuta]|uniref:Cyclin-dependent kinase 2-like n=1 Tax=Oopsacas minuta TaxID=111878 RepID=A0AAV7J802_9METZ|nr:Cyclin-dependent kinase 2-like [Oopsacas minuta]